MKKQELSTGWVLSNLGYPHQEAEGMEIFSIERAEIGGHQGSFGEDFSANKQMPCPRIGVDRDVQDIF